MICSKLAMMDCFESTSLLLYDFLLAIGTSVPSSVLLLISLYLPFLPVLVVPPDSQIRMKGFSLSRLLRTLWFLGKKSPVTPPIKGVKPSSQARSDKQVGGSAMALSDASGASFSCHS